MTSQVLLVAAAALLAQAGASVPPDPPHRVIVDGAVTVPMHLGRGLPLIDVKVNGQGPFTFGIETGANFVAITPALAATLKLARAGGAEDFPSYRVETLEAGAARFEGLTVSASQFAAPDVDGVLGLPVYRDLLLTIDYARQQVRFETGDLPAANGADILELSPVGPFWGVPLAIAGRRVTAVVDTRSSGALGVTPDVAGTLPWDGELMVMGMARGAGIPATEVKAGTLKGDVVLGAYTFPSPTISARPLPPDFPQNPVIGTIVLQQFTVTLDQRNWRIRFAREGTRIIALPSPMRRQP